MPRMPARSPAPSSLTVDAALFTVALMWASTFTLFKIAWRDIDPVAFTAIRFATMFLLAIAMLVASRNRVRPRRQDIPLLVASGLTGYFLYQMGFVLGLERSSALASAILISTHPIFSVVFNRVTNQAVLDRAWAARVKKLQIYGGGPYNPVPPPDAKRPKEWSTFQLRSAI